MAKSSNTASSNAAQNYTHDNNSLHAARDIIGYLNFSSGSYEPRFMAGWNTIFDFLVKNGSSSPWSDSLTCLRSALEVLGNESEAFRRNARAIKVLAMMFSRVLPDYRLFHADLLFHQKDELLFNPFFLAKVCSLILTNESNWNDEAKTSFEVIRSLNDFIGYRPIPVFENETKHEPDPHEWVCPVPLYQKGVGVAHGPYRDIVEQTLQILSSTNAGILHDAWFDPDRLEELALDPRAYDFDHPVNRRPNYSFGTWDLDCLDQNGYYRRFVVHQVTLEGILERTKQTIVAPPDMNTVPVKSLNMEGGAVLAGTMLMGSSITGDHVQTHDSTISLSHLMASIAGYRDRFYIELIQRVPDVWKTRLDHEAKRLFQPFGGARQDLNKYLAKRRANQLQRFHLGRTYARMGYFEAAKQQAAIISVPSARFLCQIDSHLSQAHLLIGKKQLQEAFELIPLVEDLLHRGIACGAIPDPWTILGFGAEYTLFQTAESVVHDHRIDDLINLMEDVFDLYSRLQKEAAASGLSDLQADLSDKMSDLAGWWDQFGSTEISGVEGFSAQEAWESAAKVSTALATWHHAGPAAGDVAFWRRHVERFRSPKAFVLLGEALLEQGDFVSAMALLMHWLSESESIELADGGYSFHTICTRWMENLWNNQAADDSHLVKSRKKTTTVISVEEFAVRWKKGITFLDRLEANAGEYWNIPSLELAPKFFETTAASLPTVKNEISRDVANVWKYLAAKKGLTVFLGENDDFVSGKFHLVEITVLLSLITNRSLFPSLYRLLFEARKGVDHILPAFEEFWKQFPILQELNNSLSERTDLPKILLHYFLCFMVIVKLQFEPKGYYEALFHSLGSNPHENGHQNKDQQDPYPLAPYRGSKYFQQLSLNLGLMTPTELVEACFQELERQVPLADRDAPSGIKYRFDGKTKIDAIPKNKTGDVNDDYHCFDINDILQYFLFDDADLENGFAGDLDAIEYDNDEGTDFVSLFVYLANSTDIPLDNSSNNNNTDAPPITFNFDFDLEANLDLLAAMARQEEEKEEEEKARGIDPTYSAAYDNVSFHDSAEDGVDDDMMEQESSSFRTEDESELTLESERIDERLAFIFTLVRLWKSIAGKTLLLSSVEKKSLQIDESLYAWFQQLCTYQDELYRLLDQASHYHVPFSGSTAESLMEYDQHRGSKEILIDRVVWALVEINDTQLFLEAILQEFEGDHVSGKGKSPDWHANICKIFAAIFQSDQKKLRQLWPETLDSLEQETLLYIPTSRGGDPRLIVQCRCIQQVVLRLLESLPRLGCLSEAFFLLRSVQNMERIHPHLPGAITEFDRIFETATKSIAESIIESSKSWRIKPNKSSSINTLEDAVVSYTENAVDILLACWLSHSRHIRISAVEAIMHKENWVGVKDFIIAYGADLFVQQFLNFRNIRAILHQGAEHYLEELIRLRKEDREIEGGAHLIDDIIANKCPLKKAVFYLEIILECVAENYSEYIDYNSTTTQSDHGEKLYILLDMLRVLTAYERVSWNLKPVYWVHEVIVRSGEIKAATLWEQSIAKKSTGLSEENIRNYNRLNALYGIWLPSIYERLQERFVRPLRIDRMCALVGPAVDDIRKETHSGAFEELEQHVEEFAKTPMGVGFEVPEWLDALQNEVIASHLGPQRENLDDLILFGAEDRFKPVRLSRQEIDRQLRFCRDRLDFEE